VGINFISTGNTMRTMNYFAYGSNVNFVELFERATAAGVKNPAEHFRVAAKTNVFLHDYKLGFTRFSKSRNGGVLDLVRAKGHYVRGALIAVSEEGLKFLDHKEGVANGAYERFDCVVAINGKEEAAVSYKVKSPAAQYIKPHPDYVKVVVTGFQRLDIDSAQVIAASQNEPAACRLCNLFVYGSLRRGAARHHYLVDAGIKKALPAEKFGQLYDCGNFVGMYLNPEPDSARLVQGEGYNIDQIETLLERLDQVEGFYGDGNPNNLFRRVVTDFAVGERGRVELGWVYVLTTLRPQEKQIAAIGSSSQVITVVH
jgi:gamma-glutamylcyclotransferase (GGCT)/AIG2-like uncharacterized protein YtfP